MQFDQLQDHQVIWEPYRPDRVQARYPGGISSLCRRDENYWMTRARIVFDVTVEEMAQQRVMRQFGKRQLPDPPTRLPLLPPHIHRYNFIQLCLHERISSVHSNYKTSTCFRLSRQGDRPLASWLQKLQPYIADWETATDNVWPGNEPFQLDDFYAYLQAYRQGSRLRLVHTTQPDQLPPPAITDMYPLQTIGGTRNYAVRTT